MDNSTNIDPATKKKGMKKSAKITLLIFSIVFFLAAIITPIAIFAVPKDEDHYSEKTFGDFVLRYDSTEGFYDIVRYIGDSNDVTIPSKIDGKPVRYVLADAFNAEKRASNRNIESVTIEEGVSQIGASAFKGCENIKELVLPESMTTIGSKAFEGSGIEKLSIKDASTLTLLADSLDGATQLKVLSILGASDALKSGSLSNISGTITDVEIGNGVEVGADAFNGLDSIRTLSVYNYADLVVDENAFEGSKITTLNIYWAEDNLTKEFMSKFESLTTLTTVNLDSKIVKIMPEALSMFGRLSSLTMGDGTQIDISSLPLGIPAADFDI
ncbi:MAG: leucine-rich repeat protein, partial [Clostridia bacterium]|nr:leucine-rich repeat protein [Clostridia bacterium]